MWKSLKKSHSQNGTFCLSGCLSFLIKYISEQYIVLVFMILSALLILFFSTEMLVNVFFLLENQVKKYYSWFCQLSKSLIVVNIILSKYVITNQIAQTADVCKIMLPINSD